MGKTRRGCACRGSRTLRILACVRLCVWERIGLRTRIMMCYSWVQGFTFDVCVCVCVCVQHMCTMRIYGICVHVCRGPWAVCASGEVWRTPTLMTTAVWNDGLAPHAALYTAGRIRQVDACFQERKPAHTAGALPPHCVAPATKLHMQPMR